MATNLSESTWNLRSRILISLKMLPRLMSLNVGLEVTSKCLSSVLTVCNFTELHVWLVAYVLSTLLFMARTVARMELDNWYFDCTVINYVHWLHIEISSSVICQIMMCSASQSRQYRRDVDKNKWLALLDYRPSRKWIMVLWFLWICESLQGALEGLNKQ